LIKDCDRKIRAIVAGTIYVHVESIAHVLTVNEASCDPADFLSVVDARQIEDFDRVVSKILRDGD